MSKLIEGLRGAIEHSEQVESNLAYISIASGRALLAHIERLESALQMIANCGLDAGQCRQAAESAISATQAQDGGGV